MPHTSYPCSLAPSEASRLRAIDHDEASLGSLELEDLWSGNDTNAKFVLLESIRTDGQVQPIVVFSRKNGPGRIVDGHHRALIAMKLGRPVSAVIHHCSCDHNDLDFFGLCSVVRREVSK